MESALEMYKEKYAIGEIDIESLIWHVEQVLRRQEDYKLFMSPRQRLDYLVRIGGVDFDTANHR